MGGDLGPDVEYGPKTPRVPAEERPPVGPDVEFGSPRITSPEPDLTGPSGDPNLTVDTGAGHGAGQADVLEQTEPS